MSINRVLSLICAVAGAAAFAAAPFQANKKPLVFILAGQSNMQGHALFKKGEDDALSVLPPGVSFYLDGVKTDNFSDVPHHWFGPEVSLAHTLRAAIPGREIILIKRAKGGTNMAYWSPGKLSSGIKTNEQGVRQGTAFSLLLDDVKRAVGDEAVEWGAFFWMQGENDCRTEQEASAYCSALTKLAGAVRKETGAQELPFIFGQVNPPVDGAKPHPFRDIVRAQQELYEKQDPNARRVLTDDLAKAQDNLHYNREGQLELGRRFAEAWLSLKAGKGDQ